VLASTDDSERLNRTEVMVSVDVGKDKFEMGALLQTFRQTRHANNAEKRTSFRPIFAQYWTPLQREGRFYDGLLSCNHSIS